MREMHVMVADVLSAEMDALHQRHGPWRLIRALVATLVRRSMPSAGNRLSDLDNYQRRDIGLPEITNDPVPFERARYVHGSLHLWGPR